MPDFYVYLISINCPFNIICKLGDRNYFFANDKQFIKRYFPDRLACRCLEKACNIRNLPGKKCFKDIPVEVYPLIPLEPVFFYQRSPEIGFTFNFFESIIKGSEVFANPRRDICVESMFFKKNTN
jgi:hypothetical protein